MTLMALLWLVVWILVLVAVVLLLYWAIDMLAGALGMPPQLLKIVKAIIAVVAVIVVIVWIVGVIGPPPHFAIE